MCHPPVTTRACDTQALALGGVNFLPNEPERAFVNGEQKNLLRVGPPAGVGARDSGIRGEQSQTAASVSQLQPRFVRLPKPGTLCPFTGLSRTQMYLLCKSGKVKSYSLKRRGARRGVRLIDYQSLVATIEEFASTEG
jgi:hypothetical protein